MRLGTGMGLGSSPPTAAAAVALAPIAATGGDISDRTVDGRLYRFHVFDAGTNNFTPTDLGNGLNSETKVLLVGGGASGARGVAGSGGNCGAKLLIDIGELGYGAHVCTVGARGTRRTTNDTASEAGGATTVLMAGDGGALHSVAGGASSGHASGNGGAGAAGAGATGTPTTIGGDGGLGEDLSAFMGIAYPARRGGGGAGDPTRGEPNGADGPGTAGDGTGNGPGSGGGGSFNGYNSGYGTRGVIVWRYPLEATP